MAETGLCLDNLQIHHRDGRLLAAVNTQVAPGTVVSLMGPSGVGKSTILSAITGALAPEFTCSGVITLNGRKLNELAPQKRRVGILFQDHLLFPHLSVGQNIGFGLPPGVDDRATKIDAALYEIGLEGFTNRDPDTLSGGQRARVALMRMLLAEPEAILLDEPFSRLDATLRDRMRKLVFDRARAANLPVLMVTHDKADADAAGGEVIELTLSD
ncbi:ATP-binding cassette domain-containing protein [Cognatishimia activa]|uniref:Thiamine import ATP-binding protein ThiQ n=1 Tax=Cognatishimia activa TaxID=1715691 RepID=A0A0P1IXI3_9RHOB|nr:ATP-binding cassette domain-containing protein [Cognatishimia activa]CUI74286.1 Thiamine import ATP-binding protein ThiQ [Cognatishimia activa]CUK26673.1 Thiamine import ATP-binding protein ThiQ [Cognatishimia activa]